VNLAKPQKIKEGSSKAVWSDDTWLQEHAGKTLNKDGESGTKQVAEDSEKVRFCTNIVATSHFIHSTALY
jgi:peptidyl-prolyl isomerase E (cyclophilin E)